MENLIRDNLSVQTNTQNDRGIVHEFGPENVMTIDNLFDHHFVSEYENWMMTDQSWFIDNTANRYSKPYGLEGYHKFLAITHYQFHESINPEFSGVARELSTVLDNVRAHLSIQDSFLNSIQSNAMPYKHDGTWHQDVGGVYNSMFNGIVAVDQMYSLMFFGNSVWKNEWGKGKFYYKDNSDKEHSIDYVPGRVILFPAVLHHRADAPEEPYIFRLSTVFRLIMTIEWVYNHTDPVPSSSQK